MGVVKQMNVAAGNIRGLSDYECCCKGERVKTYPVRCMIAMRRREYPPLQEPSSMGSLSMNQRQI